MQAKLAEQAERYDEMVRDALPAARERIIELFGSCL